MGADAYPGRGHERAGALSCSAGYPGHEPWLQGPLGELYQAPHRHQEEDGRRQGTLGRAPNGLIDTFKHLVVVWLEYK